MRSTPVVERLKIFGIEEKVTLTNFPHEGRPPMNRSKQRLLRMLLEDRIRRIYRRMRRNA
jgi:hypothetical protein